MRFCLNICLIIIFLGVQAGPYAQAEQLQSYEGSLQKANEALQRRQYLKAIEYLTEAQKISPSATYPKKKILAIQELIRRKNWDRYDESGRLKLYQKYAKLAKESFEKGDYKRSSYYLRNAYILIAWDQRSGNYIHSIDHVQDKRADVKESLKPFTKPSVSQSSVQKSSNSKAIIAKPTVGKKVVPGTVIAKNISPYVQLEERTTQVKTSGPPSKMPVVSAQSVPKMTAPSKSTTKKKKGKSAPPVEIILTMDDLLWSTQPKTVIEIDKGGYLILEGDQIDRYIVIAPGVLDIQRIDRDHLKITGVRVASTFVHVWDKRSRWTFNVRVKFPQMDEVVKPPVKPDEVHAAPFRLSYSVDGGVLYRGPSTSSLKRDSLNMQQTVAVKGETPYGIADGSVGYYKFKESTEATNYTIGLSGLQGAGFTSVNLRGYDAVKYFSPLTFPGQYFRGFLIEGKTFNEHLGGVYVHGQDRFTYSYISPGVVENRRSYIEAARVTVDPNEENQYSFNYARGYGPARQDFLKSQVYSVEAQHRIDPVLLKGEVATNTDTLAELFASKWGSPDRNFYLNFRDIDKDFTTITSLPSNRGEIGADVGMDWELERSQVHTNLDFFRDRLLPNEEDPHALNYDWNGSIEHDLTDTLDFLTAAYYLDTPGQLSARRNFRWMNTLTQRFKLPGKRWMRVYAGTSYHRNRLKEVPISEYDRYALTSGLQIDLIERLSYFANYEYSWLDELMDDEFAHPSVFNTGLNYSQELTQRTSMNSSLYYRDEQNAGQTNSFLAGEDSITGSLGISFRPTDSAELFLDSRLRNVWRENPENPAYNEVDVRWGLRSGWDLPVSWSPWATVQGVVYKDLNADGKKDLLEPGLQGVRMRVGKRQVTTGPKGQYKVKLMAKEAVVSVDPSSVPNGYVLTTPPVQELILPYKESVNFGFTAQSGIYGLVYQDLNHDNVPNDGDEFIQDAKIILDGKTVETTDYDGTYAFRNVASGRHVIRVDVNSLPMEYLPLIKLSNAVEVTEGTVYVFHVPLAKRNK